MAKGGETARESPVTGDSLDRWGPTAIISYLNLLVFTLTAVGVFMLIVQKVEITAVWAGIVGGILGATGGGLATTNQFWLGGNVGAKAATSALKQIAAGSGTGPGGASITAPLATSQTVNVAPPATGPDDEDGFIPRPPGAQP